MFAGPIFFLSQYFECKQADIEWILNKVSKIIVYKYLASEKGMGRIFIFNFDVNVAKICGIWDLKGYFIY